VFSTHKNSTKLIFLTTWFLRIYKWSEFQTLYAKSVCTSILLRFLVFKFFCHILQPGSCAGTLVMIKPGFHYPSWRVTGFYYPSTRAVLTITETGHPSTRAVNSGSGNQALVTVLVDTGFWTTLCSFSRTISCMPWWRTQSLSYAATVITLPLLKYLICVHSSSDRLWRYIDNCVCVCVCVWKTPTYVFDFYIFCTSWKRNEYLQLTYLHSDDVITPSPCTPQKFTS